jgi:RNA polymerase sigma-70 factor (family 1)
MSRESKSLSDSDLVFKIRTGDRHAFASFYDRYHVYIYHLSLKFLKSPELAEEAVQDVFLKVWEHRTALDPERSVRGYLLACCRNHLINLLAKKGPEFQSIDHDECEEIADYYNPIDKIILADYTELAEKGISTLPPQRQKVFRMYRLENRSLEEIASELGTTKGTVKDHLLKATRHLRLYLKEYSGIRIDMLLLLFLMDRV